MLPSSAKSAPAARSFGAIKRCLRPITSGACPSTRPPVRAPSCSACSRSTRALRLRSAARPVLRHGDHRSRRRGGGAGLLDRALLVRRRAAPARRAAALAQPGEEAPLLEAFAERVAACDLLVSYNGKTFDLPLLNGRMVMNRLPKLPDRAHLDLLHVARRLHKRRLGPCRLIGLESEVLGFVRGPDIAGIDIAPRYDAFPALRRRKCARASCRTQRLGRHLDGGVGRPCTANPSSCFHEQDLVGLARNHSSAPAPSTKRNAPATVALERGAGPEARRAHGEIAKARGDRARALAPLRSLRRPKVDDPLIVWNWPSSTNTTSASRSAHSAGRRRAPTKARLKPKNAALGWNRKSRKPPKSRGNPEGLRSS